MKRHIERTAHIAKAQSRLGSINRFVAAGYEIDKEGDVGRDRVHDIHCQAQPADGRWRRVWVASEEDVVYDGYTLYVRRFVSSKVHESEGSLVRRFVS